MGFSSERNSNSCSRSPIDKFIWGATSISEGQEAPIYSLIMYGTLITGGAGSSSSSLGGSSSKGSLGFGRGSSLELIDDSSSSPASSPSLSLWPPQKSSYTLKS
jgi:hypothetical protein